MRLTDTFFSNHRGALCSILAALFLSQSGRATPLQREYRSLQSRGDIKCPDSSTYAEVQDSMKKNESNFISKKGGHLLKWTPAGLEMHINEANVSHASVSILFCSCSLVLFFPSFIDCVHHRVEDQVWRIARVSTSIVVLMPVGPKLVSTVQAFVLC